MNRRITTPACNLLGLQHTLPLINADGIPFKVQITQPIKPLNTDLWVATITLNNALLLNVIHAGLSLREELTELGAITNTLNALTNTLNRSNLQAILTAHEMETRIRVQQRIAISPAALTLYPDLQFARPIIDASPRWTNIDGVPAYHSITQFWKHLLSHYAHQHSSQLITSNK